MAFPYMEAVIAISIFYTNLSSYLWTLQFCSLGYCPGFGRGLESSWCMLTSMQKMRYYILLHLAGVMFWSQITDLPFSLYSTFVIEARHGFNKQTVWLFFRDMIKGIALAIVIGPPIVAAIIIIVQKGGPYLAIYLWAFMLIVSLVMMTLYPVLIAPLFNKFTPLPEGDLRAKIENLASSLKFPLKKLFVIDGSTRSSHSNMSMLSCFCILAYMYGFFKNKRIVLYDTLIQQSEVLNFLGIEHSDATSGMSEKNRVTCFIVSYCICGKDAKLPSNLDYFVTYKILRNELVNFGAICIASIVDAITRPTKNFVLGNIICQCLLSDGFPISEMKLEPYLETFDKVNIDQMIRIRKTVTGKGKEPASTSHPDDIFDDTEAERLAEGDSTPRRSVEHITPRRRGAYVPWADFEALEQENSKLKKSVKKLKNFIKELLPNACFSSDEE